MSASQRIRYTHRKFTKTKVTTKRKYYVNTDDIKKGKKRCPICGKYR